jgi:hypothetical protein
MGPHQKVSTPTQTGFWIWSISCLVSFHSMHFEEAWIERMQLKSSRSALFMSLWIFDLQISDTGCWMSGERHCLVYICLMCNGRVWTFPEARLEEVSTRILSIPEVPINVGALNSKFLCKSDICLFLWANRKILGVVFFCCHIMCCVIMM